MNNNILKKLNKGQKTEDYPVRVTFEVVCHSDTSMCDGITLKQRIGDYIKMCTDAMDDSMCHWGEHYHDIEPVKIALYDENDNYIDITDEYFNEDE